METKTTQQTPLLDALCNGNGGEAKQKRATFAHKRTAKRVDAVKRKARSELRANDWDAVGYASDARWADGRDASTPLLDTIERVDGTALSGDAFRERVEQVGKPVVLTGLTDNWAAQHQWTVEKLLRAYRNQTFKCGEDDDGYSVKLKFKYYVDYATTTRDDSPLYIFDSSFGERTKTSKLLADYSVPPMFTDDLFRYATERRRPPYRWFVMGPARSGTAIHIDPLGTSAWNALIVGRKRWCLLHPSTPKHLVKPSREERNFHSDEAITWFQTVFRRVTSSRWPSERFPVIHAVQKAGEVLFVPSGWWHVVVNLDMTIAVTQNFASVVNLPKVWPKTVRTRRAFAIHWLKALQRERPELMDTIWRMNQARGFAIPWDLSEPFDSSSSSSSSSSSCSSSNESDADNNSSNNNNNNGEQHHGGGVAAATQRPQQRAQQQPQKYLNGRHDSGVVVQQRQQQHHHRKSSSTNGCCDRNGVLGSPLARERRKHWDGAESSSHPQPKRHHHEAKRSGVETVAHLDDNNNGTTMAAKRLCLSSPRFAER